MAELLVSATNNNNQQIGEIVDVKPDGHVWGNREQPPSYVHVTVTGASVDQVVTYLGAWEIRYEQTIQVDNPQRYRIRVRVDPAYISVSGMGRNEMKAAMGQWIADEWNGTVIVTGTDEQIYDIPKPVDLAALALDFADIWNTTLGPRRYHFAAVDVADALANGGSVTLTVAQAQAIIVDKLTL